MSRRRKHTRGRVTDSRKLTFPPNLVRGMSPTDVRSSAVWPTVFALRRAGVCLPGDVGHIMQLIGRTFTAPNRAET